MAFKIKCIDNNGDIHYVQTGDKVAVFHNRKQAQEKADFLAMGMSDEYPIIRVVRCPPYGADRGENDA